MWLKLKIEIGGETELPNYPDVQIGRRQRTSRLNDKDYYI